MFYVFSHTPTETLTEKTAYELDMKLTAGIIHQVDVLFQDGCDHNHHVQIFHANFQVWPSNRNAELTGNATVISFREFYEIKPSDPPLTAHIWSTHADTWNEVIVQIGLLPRKIIQPLSFDELLAAAAGIK
ncbi:hypothetical protein ES703_14521 [subsurface metagenome]